MYYINTYNSPIGKITLSSDGQNLTGLWIDGQKHLGFNKQYEYTVKELPIFQETSKWLEIYFSGEEPNFTPPIKFQGTSFQQKVWRILETIPYGQTITYGQIAKLVVNGSQKKMSAQAVGGAVGHNHISIIVPCHRVVGTNNNLIGYDGGIDKKIFLLSLEGVDISQFSD